MTTINFKHEVTKEVKQAPIGFSWTNLIFGFLVPLFRGDFKNSLIQLVVSLCTGGASWIFFPFFYNKTYIKKLMLSGFVAADEHSRRVLEIESI